MNMPMPITRRSFIKGLSLTGLAGCSGLFPVFAPAMSAASSASETMTETRLLMGTFVSITLAGSSMAHMREGLEQVFSFMEKRAALFDRHQSSTPVGVLNAQGSLKDAPPELTGLLARSAMFGELSGHAFNISVQPLVELYSRHSDPAGRMRLSAKEIAEARDLVMTDGIRLNGNSVSFVKSGMGLTLDGIAKGHVADAASLYLTGLGLSHHLVNAGGDIVAAGRKGVDQPWTVAVSDPSAPSRAWAGQRPLSLENAALATSGSYQMVYDTSGEFHHLIDPREGKSPMRTVSVSVLARTAMEADALATTLSVMPPREGLAMLAGLPDRECLMITRSGQRIASPGWISG